MGAVQWSPEELDYFRNELLPISQYSKSYLDKYNGGMAFEELWPVIQYELRDIHNPPRRTYTSQILFQHYYQGLKRRGISRNKKGHSVRLTPTKLARVRKLREQLRDGFFGKLSSAIPLWRCVLLWHCLAILRSLDEMFITTHHFYHPSTLPLAYYPPTILHPTTGFKWAMPNFLWATLWDLVLRLHPSVAISRAASANFWYQLKRARSMKLFPHQS